MLRGMLGKLIFLVLMLTLINPGGFTSPKKAAAQTTDAALAYRWAPVHYQDTDSSHYSADYITAIDYDGDWNTKNNWENLDADSSRLKAKVYYSVVETTTHWFIGYNYYHPRDWTDVDFLGIDQHENDLEGILLTIAKDGSEFGRLEAMVTVFHSDFFSYTPTGGAFTSGQESIDGTLRTLNVDGVNRPVTFAEAKGHGVKAWDGNAFANTDVVVYFPSGTLSEVPSGGNDRDVKYQLVDIFTPGGLWDRRFDSQTFANWGTFLGDNGWAPNGANAPWGFNDGNDGEVERGEIALHPAKLTSLYFSNIGTFSTTYVRNPFTDGVVNRLEAFSPASLFVRHANARGRVDANVTPPEDSQWRMIPGLADPAGVSFESVNYPGQFLRHRNGEVWRDGYVGETLFRADATFYPRAGLADSSLVSYESFNYPGRYLRHRNSLLYNESISTALDKSDATFRVH